MSMDNVYKNTPCLLSDIIGNIKQQTEWAKSCIPPLKTLSVLDLEKPIKKSEDEDDFEPEVNQEKEPEVVEDEEEEEEEIDEDDFDIPPLIRRVSKRGDPMYRAEWFWEGSELEDLESYIAPGEEEKIHQALYEGEEGYRHGQIADPDQDEVSTWFKNYVDIFSKIMCRNIAEIERPYMDWKKEQSDKYGDSKSVDETSLAGALISGEEEMTEEEPSKIAHPADSEFIFREMRIKGFLDQLEKLPPEELILDDGIAVEDIHELIRRDLNEMQLVRIENHVLELVLRTIEPAFAKILNKIGSKESEEITRLLYRLGMLQRPEKDKGKDKDMDQEDEAESQKSESDDDPVINYGSEYRVHWTKWFSEDKLISMAEMAISFISILSDALFEDYIVKYKKVRAAMEVAMWSRSLIETFIEDYKITVITTEKLTSGHVIRPAPSDVLQ